MSFKNKNIKELLRLVQENPDLPIVPMVDAEIVCDDCGYWMGSWGHAEIDEYYINDQVYFKSDDFDELVEDWADTNYDEFPGKSGYEIEQIAKEYVGNYKWVKAIVVYIGMP